MPDKQKNYLMIIIHANGRITKVVQKNKFSLEQLQGGVGGYIQELPYFKSLVIKIDDETITYNRGMCYGNEEGQLLNLPINQKATKEWYRQCKAVNYYLLGDIVFTARTEEKVHVREHA